MTENNFHLNALISRWGTAPQGMEGKIGGGQIKVLKEFIKKYPRESDEMFKIAGVDVIHEMKRVTATWILGNLQFLHKHHRSKSQKTKTTLKPKIISPVKRSIRIDYYEYIASPEWHEKSKQAKLRVGNRCQICNRSSREIVLHTHHRTYARLGHEKNEDLTVLCADCHKLYEDNKKLKKNH